MLIDLLVRTPGQEDWETSMDENDVPMRVVYRIREHFGWETPLQKINVLVEGRDGNLRGLTTTLGDSTAYAGNARRPVLLVSR